MNKKKSSVKPRKLPAQARSRATVEAIMESATYILTKMGWDGLTTNAIAEKAGVNIGSLYQFFPNKEAIITELQRRHAVATQTELFQTLDILPQQRSLRDALMLIVEGIITEHRIAPAMHKAIHEELPGSIRHLNEDKQNLHRLFSDALKPFMTNVPDPELSVYLMGVALHGIVHTVTADRPDLLKQQHLVTEIVTLFESYLSRSGEKVILHSENSDLIQR